MKIIAVDDMKQNRYLLQKLLEGYGYTVETASNGVEALEKVRASPPDMIITDVLMPRMDGFQLCRTLKSDEKLKDIPVLFYSAEYTDKESRKLALDIGAIDYLIKPIEPDEFIKIVKEVLDKYGKGELKPTEKPLEERVYMKLYNERLIQKLEKKMLDLEKSEKRIRHLNSVLKAIGKVNQLITMEKDRDRLLQGACDNLIETRGHYNAWIALIDESGSLVTTAEAGLGKDFLPLVERLKRGELTNCGQKALAQSEVVATEDPFSTCTNCPLSDKYHGRGALTVRLEYGEKVYGLLSVSVPKEFTADEEEQNLFKEVAGDLAFALYRIDLEEEQKRAEDKIKEAYRLREHFLKETSHRIITPVSIIGGHTDLLLERGNLDDAQKEKIMIIRERNEEVEKLVRDALAGKYLEEEEGGEG